jgi:hypothetical protein
MQTLSLKFDRGVSINKYQMHWAVAVLWAKQRSTKRMPPGMH